MQMSWETGITVIVEQNRMVTAGASGHREISKMITSGPWRFSAFGGSECRSAGPSGARAQSRMVTHLLILLTG
jgi:hypothetical protein